MWPFGKKKKPIDVEIERVLSQMSGMDPATEEYSVCVTNLQTLHDARSFKTGNQVTADTGVLVITSILETVLMLYFEQGAAISSKVLSTIIKPKL
jgi:uncharacterized protein